MANFAAHAATPIYAGVSFATANTALDGSGTIATLYTVPSGCLGIRIDNAFFTALTTTTAGAVRIFLKDPAGTNAFEFLEELPVGAVTVALGTTVPWNAASVLLVGMSLTPGVIIGLATHNAATFKGHLIAGRF